MLAKYPKLIPSPIAENGDKSELELTSAEVGAMTYNSGFPPITSVSVKKGGKAPKREDFNAAFNDLSQHIFFMQNGGRYKWSAELDYSVGSIVLGSDGWQYEALQVSGGSSGGAKDPTLPDNSAFWKKLQTIQEHNEDLNAHNKLIEELKKGIQAYKPGDFLISFSQTVDGFLLCDGSAISRTTYADLFKIINTRFGVGDNSTTFNLPDFRDKFIQGANGNLGSVKEAGLPNISDTYISLGTLSTGLCPFETNGKFLGYTMTSQIGAQTPIREGQFSLQNVNSIYGRSKTVQPPAITLNIFIKY